MEVKLKDLEVADMILDIIFEEVAALKVSKDRSPAEIIKLEKIAKTYQIIMASTRENIRSGLFGNLTNEDLVNTTDDTDEETYEADEL